MRPKDRDLGELVSEKGYLELVGRIPEVSLREAMLGFRDLVSADMEWLDSRKKRYRAPAGRIRVVTLILTAASMVVLGIPQIPDRASWVPPLVAGVALLGGLEAFYNWRSRQLLMEESQYRMNRVRDDLDYYLVTTPASDLK